MKTGKTVQELLLTLLQLPKTTSTNPLFEIVEPFRPFCCFFAQNLLFLTIKIILSEAITG